MPLRGVRLTRGLYRQTGAPYAQTPSFADIRLFLTLGQARWDRALRHVREGWGGQPGNLDDAYAGDVGIDCSALLQLAWSARTPATRIDTGILQTEIMAGRCPHRLPEAAHLRAGDAIGIRIWPSQNHVALWAGALRADGASDVWLVLESSSGCDGVCWSLYDPSYFNGWGLYRADGRTDAPCPTDAAATDIVRRPIPLDAAAWRRQVWSR